MLTIKSILSRQTNRLWSRYRALGLALILCLLPLAAWAHDGDEPPIPIDPQTQRAQLITFGVVAALVVGFALFYYIRRWQLLNSDKFQEGYSRDED